MSIVIMIIALSVRLSHGWSCKSGDSACSGGSTINSFCCPSVCDVNIGSSDMSCTGCSNTCSAEDSSGNTKKIGACTSNGDCTSDSCKGNTNTNPDLGGCCTTKGLTAGCTDCYSIDGDCKHCDANFYLKDYACVACATGKTSPARSSSISACIGSSSVPAQGSSTKETGSCTNNGDCTSNSCKESQCCTTKGTTPGCNACYYSAGDCKTCDANYYIKDYACIKCAEGKTSPAGSSSISACTTAACTYAEASESKILFIYCRKLFFY